MCTLAIKNKVYHVVPTDMQGEYDIYCNGVLEQKSVERGFIIGYFSSVMETNLK